MCCSNAFPSVPKTAPNRFAVQPMEGCDARGDGAPEELTFRRYKRYARGGSGLIWFEAASVTEEGRSGPHQLVLKRQTLDGFKRLVEQTRNAAYQEFNSAHDILCILQLTHSGRFSRPSARALPQVACLNPFLDKDPDNMRILSDDELERLQDIYLEAARLAGEAGFDGVDIKACHGYLVHDLMAARMRRNSRYGGAFAARVRFLIEVCERIRNEMHGFLCASRVSAYDGLPYPYGFGVSREETGGIDYDEPRRLISALAVQGCTLLNITAGIPSLHPYISRPFDRPACGTPLPPEHPLQGVMRLIATAGEIQLAFPDIPVVGTGYTWLRQFFPYVGAAVIQQGKASFIGLGRSSLAYPDAPKDLMEKGRLNSDKICISCSRCTDLMRAGSISGCSVRDRDIYSRAYKRAFPKKGKPEVL